MKYRLKCVVCGAEKIYEARTRNLCVELARADGAAITRNNEYFCPNHAELCRHVGCKGGLRNFQLRLG